MKLRFGRRGRARFTFIRGPVQIPARTLAARPVIDPAIKIVEPKMVDALAKVIDDALQKSVPRG